MAVIIHTLNLSPSNAASLIDFARAQPAVFKASRALRSTVEAALFTGAVSSSFDDRNGLYAKAEQIARRILAQWEAR